MNIFGRFNSLAGAMFLNLKIIGLILCMCALMIFGLKSKEVERNEITFCISFETTYGPILNYKISLETKLNQIKKLVSKINKEYLTRPKNRVFDFGDFGVLEERLSGLTGRAYYEKDLCFRVIFLEKPKVDEILFIDAIKELYRREFSILQESQDESTVFGKLTNEDQLYFVIPGVRYTTIDISSVASKKYGIPLLDYALLFLCLVLICITVLWFVGSSLYGEGGRPAKKGKND